MTPTPETHVYKGMFRPPWEDIRRRVETSREFEMVGHGTGHFVRKVPVPTSFGENSYSAWGAVWEGYLAGHFDVPQYEPKKPKDHAERICSYCGEPESDHSPAFGLCPNGISYFCVPFPTDRPHAGHQQDVTHQPPRAAQP